jgi:hypothetical protein
VNPPRTVVVAGTEQQARLWAARRGLSLRAWYSVGPDDGHALLEIRGLDGRRGTLVKVGTYGERRDINELSAQLNMQGFDWSGAPVEQP